jgi:oxygen-dependent protoporphyrinogen oxidase
MTVAIIGGGLAGLTCAYRLKQHRIESVVFEASNSAAGRSAIQHRDGFTLDAGAQYLLGPEVFRSSFDLIRELGMGEELVPIQPFAGQLYKGRVYHHRVASASGLLHFRGLHLLDKALLPKMAVLLSRYGAALDFQHPERGLELDDESVAQFIRREFSQSILNYVAGPLISSLFFYPSHETSKLLYLLLAKHMHRTTMYTLRGGIGTLSLRLAGQTSMQRGTTINEVGHSDGAFLIDGRRFQAIVVAVPGNAVLAVSGLRELMEAADREYFEQCSYQRAVTVFVATEQPVDGSCYALAIPKVEERSAMTISFHNFMDPSRSPVGAGLLAVTGGGDEVTVEDLLRDARAIYPAEMLARPRFIETREWRSAMPKFPPGRYRETAAFHARQRLPGLFFCGDYLMGPFLEGAIATGLRTADAIATSGFGTNL